MAVESVEAFRDWMRSEYRADGKFEAVRVLEGADAGGADLAVRLEVGNRSYYEARVDLAASQVQIGFATESRTINEAIEQSILDNGGDLDDLLADELCDLGEDPLPMEHFFERPAFRFTCRLPVESPEALLAPGFRQRVKRVLRASEILFQACVDEA